MNRSLRKKAERILKQRGIADKNLYTKSLESLVEELSIYQIELEQQNQELQASQQDLIHAKNRFADLFNTAPVGYFILSDNNKIVDINATACKMLNLDVNDVKNTMFQKLIHPDYQDIFYFHVKKVREIKGPVMDDLKMKLTDGKPFFVRLLSNLDSYYSASQQYIRMTLMDIDHEKQLELKLLEEREKLRESEQRWQFAVDGSHLGLWDWNMLNDEVFFSPQWKKILGHTNGELKGKLDCWKKRIHPDDAERVEREIRKHLNGKTEIYCSEHRVLCKDGHYKWVMDRGKVISKTADNKPLRMIGTQMDISERKETEKAIINNQRLSAMGELAFGVAHDYNNAMQSILGAVELVLMKELPVDSRRYLESIKESAQAASMRVRHLQRFARKRSKSGTQRTCNVNRLLSETIMQTKSLWADQSHKKGISINIKTDFEDGLYISANKTEIRSVFYNIVKNSVEAMPNGGTIRFRTYVDGDRVCISITDTGMGMDEQTESRIFQPFFTTKGFEQGKGVGMSNAYSIINEHQGRIFVDHTSPGEGTTLNVILPRAQRSVDSNNKPESVANGSAQVLWVDDEEFIRSFGSEMLASLNHHADTATSGTEALEILEKNRYDLLITDLGMPGMNGWQLAEQVKDKYPDMIIVFITGWGEEVTTEQREQYGVWRILSKPVSLEQLKKLVGEVLYLKKNNPVLRSA